MLNITLKFVIFFLFLSSLTLQSQNQDILFKHYGIRDGLLSSQINDIIQDKEGFLWFATTLGVNRFDGFSFEDFSTGLGLPTPSAISSLLCDNDGQIWIGTEQHGVFIYNPYKHTVVHYDQSCSGCALKDNYIQEIFLDSSGNIWLSTWSGLVQFNSDLNQFVLYPFLTERSQTLFNYNVILKIVEGSGGKLWLGTWGGGLHSFDPQTKVFEHFENLSSEQRSNPTWVRDLAFDHKGILWVATIGEGLFSYDLTNGVWKQYTFYEESKSPGYNRLLALHFYNEDELWIGTENGLIRFNTSLKKYQIIKDDGYGKLQDKYVNKIFLDNHRGIWVNAGGLNYYNTGGSKFTLYKKTFSENSLSDNEVYAFFERNANEFWISTNKGLNTFDPHSEHFSELAIFPGVLHLMKRRNENEIVAASLYNGIHIWNGKTSDLQSYTVHSADKSKSLLHAQTLDMEVDSHGNVWIGSQYGLSCLRKSDNSFFHLTEEAKYSKGLLSFSVPNVLLDHQEKIWVNNGKHFLKLDHVDPILFQASGPSGIILDTTLFSFSLQYTNTANSGRAKHFDGIYFWISDNGLVRWDPQTNDQRRFNKSDGLASLDIKNVTSDKANGIWIATDNGVSYLNLRTEEITNFYEEDGLQGNNFSRWASLKSSDGSIYLGGNGGFNIIRPEEIELNPYLPPVKFVGLRIFNDPVKMVLPQMSESDRDVFSIEQNISYLKDLKLSWRQNNLTIEFTALNYLYPGQNQFEYLLEGVDKEWYQINNRRFVSFSNLPEGKWLTLRVRGSNNNGIWSNKEASLRIFVKPPIWNTTWFKVFMTVLLLTIIVGVYRIRIVQLKNRQKELELKIKERTVEVEKQKREIENQNKILSVQSGKLVQQKQALEIQNKNTLLFSEMGKKITASIDLREIFKNIYFLLSDVFNSLHLAIGQLDKEKSIVSYWEMNGGKVTNQSIGLEEINRLSSYSIQHNETIFSNDLKSDVYTYLKLPHKVYEDEGFQSAMYIPLVSPTKSPIGVLVIKSELANAFNEDHFELLKNIAIYIAIALDNSITYNKLEQQSEQLREMDRVKTRFYTHISHEFRTPLSLILGPVEEMLPEENLTLKQKEYLKIINQNGRRLLRLVTQILDISKLDDGVLRLNVVKGNILETIFTIAESFRFIANTKGIHFETMCSSQEITGYFDKDKLEKIIYNLLHNAFKYTDGGERVNIHITTEPLNGNAEFACITIMDTGIGIPENQLHKIFEQYYRVENQSTQRQYGTGIGLSLVHKLIQLHHGQIHVESSEGKGTTFTVKIPLDQSQYAPKEITETTTINPDFNLHLADHGEESIISDVLLPGSQTRRKVLLVEDNLGLMIFLKNILWEQFDILTAENGISGLELLEKERPALVLSDVMMPAMDGMELCKRIKKNPETNHIPVILLTAKSTDIDRLKGMESGADMYLTKPVNSNLLVMTIKNLITSRDNVKKRYSDKLSQNADILSMKDADQEFIRRVYRVLEENLNNENLNIDTFVNQLGISRTLLYEKVKAATGHSLNKLMKNYRMNYAAKLLLEHHYLSFELAYKVGFSDPKYFGKCFKAHFGKSPKEYLQDKLAQLQ